ncbi:MAG: hypothetical protein IPJ38_09400 [Dechloromonas sp.]|uniref:Uncharacterized protein n=1 Tax=Candidatus Dechloromonas phosphorivorans TaxID=2899244 RepID=A0A935K9M4_9RHOO|nr:hypothetical protein [Candidatus Dechloromonas phosphorivorans]
MAEQHGRNVPCSGRRKIFSNFDFDQRAGGIWRRGSGTFRTSSTSLRSVALAGRDIDGDRNTTAPDIQPLAQLAYLIEYPDADFVDQAGVFGDRNELIGK